MTLPPDPLASLPASFCFPGRSGQLLYDALCEDVDAARLPSAFRWFYRVRPWLPTVVRQLLQKLRNRRLAVDERWYVPRRMLACLEAVGHPMASLWPGGAECAFVVTHDVETQHGVSLIAQIAEQEERLGFRSSWNVVPYKYHTDPGLTRDLQQRGFEMGVHGYNHDGRLFESWETFRERVPHINRAIAQLGAVGFRAPMVHRHLEWMQLLDIEYDASCFDIDPFQAMPGGVGSFWPFSIGRFVELPYTLPQDHTLWVTLGETTDAIWRDKLNVLRRWSGMALLVTHPDYMDSPQRRQLYFDFLKYVRDEVGIWHVLPRSLVRWYVEELQPPPFVPGNRSEWQAASTGYSLTGVLGCGARPSLPSQSGQSRS